jgi:hypothetical protein
MLHLSARKTQEDVMARRRAAAKRAGTSKRRYQRLVKDPYRAERREVEALLDAFKRSSAAARRTLAGEICRALKVHTRIEAALSGLR